MPVEHFEHKTFTFSACVGSLKWADFHNTIQIYANTLMKLFYLFKLHFSTLQVPDAPLNKSCIDLCIHFCDFELLSTHFTSSCVNPSHVSQACTT